MTDKQRVADVTVEHQGVHYHAYVVEGRERGVVEIYADEVLAARGTWIDDRIANRTATLPAGAFEAIEAALRPQLDRPVTVTPSTATIRG